MHPFEEQRFEEQQDTPPDMLSVSHDSMDSSRFEESSSSIDASGTLDEDVDDMGDGITPRNAAKKRVSFGTVSVQQHQLILGDCPFSDGYPISLDWRHAEPVTVSIDEYEHDHSDFDKLDMHDRQLRLRQMGYSRKDMQAQERKRKIILVEEWAFGDNKIDEPLFGLPMAKKLMQHYVTR